MRLELTRTDARRLAVKGQLLSSPRPRTIEETVRALGKVQMDPTSAVARTEHLVLFSRLGRRYRPAALERLLWEDQSLFEYRAFIVPTADFAVHRETMRRYPSTSASRHVYVRRFLRENADFHKYVLRRLRREGPLRTRDLEDRAAEAWRTGGWNDDQRSTGQMLETLWAKGEVMIVGRDGQQRLWDLADRRLPVHERRPPAGEEARSLVEGQLRAAGIEHVSRFGFTFEGVRPPGWERALAELERKGIAVPIRVDGLRGDRFAHADVLERAFRPRTVLLSPFDRLIHDRRRTLELFGVDFRLEIYVPKAKRQYGYFVMAILHGDRLIGRIDPLFDRKTDVLHVHAVHAEKDAPPGAGGAVSAAIAELAAWLGAREVAYGSVPSMWRRALGA